MVVHEPGDWFQTVLDSIAAQDYGNLKALFLLVGDAGEMPAHIRAVVPNSFVRAVDGSPGFGAAANILAFTVLNEGFPSALAGRSNTAVNLTMFAGSFAAQWGIGVLADALRATMALSTADGLRGAFVIVLVMVAVAFAWFLAGWRRHAAPPAPARA